MPEVFAARTHTRLTDLDLRASGASFFDDAALTTEMVKPRRVVDRSGRGAWSIQANGNPAWLERTIGAFGHLLFLSPNWDTYGAPHIEPTIVQSALNLLNQVMRDETPAPSVVPTSRGGIQLEWHIRGIDLEIEFHSPSRVSIAFEDQSSGDSWESELRSDVTKLCEAVRKLSRR